MNTHAISTMKLPDVGLTGNLIAELNFGLVASAGTVVEAGRKSVEMIVSSPANSVFVVSATEPTEKMAVGEVA